MYNLYGWAMSGSVVQVLKKCWSVWCKCNQWKESNRIYYRSSSWMSWILHNVYPLATKKLASPYDMLLHYCKKTANEYGIKVGDVMNLIANLGNKTNYVVHYRNLQLYLF